VTADPLAEVQRLRDQFAAGAITWADVRAAMPWKRKVWASKWWKTRRSQLIGHACTKCGREDGPMVLQHTRRTISLEQAKQKAGLTWDDWKTAHPTQPLNGLLRERWACPKCGCLSIRYRKGSNDWFCDGGPRYYPRRRKHAPFAFAEPMKVQVLNSKLAADAKKAQWEAYKASGFEASQFRAAVLLFLDETIEYYRMTHTTTYCRRCAFIADKAPWVPNP
jgi:hypothetical protein